MKQLARLPEHLQNAHFLWSESHPSAALEIAYSITVKSCAHQSSAANVPMSVDAALSASVS
jgi:hypothetical protein